ncbi:unnamed protein product, partial [Amoebophrya sp. A25]|eukprot:GSA25T00009446001.1
MDMDRSGASSKTASSPQAARAEGENHWKRVSIGEDKDQKETKAPDARPEECLIQHQAMMTLIRMSG